MANKKEQLGFGFRDLIQITYLWIPFLFNIIRHTGVPYVTNKEFRAQKNAEWAQMRADKRLEENLNNQLRKQYIALLKDAGIVKSSIWGTSIGVERLKQIPFSAFPNIDKDVSAETIDRLIKDFESYLAIDKAHALPHVRFIRFLNRQSLFMSIPVSIAIVIGAFSLSPIIAGAAALSGFAVPAGMAAVIGSAYFSSIAGISAIIGLAGTRYYNASLSNRAGGIEARFKDLGLRPPPSVKVQDGNIIYQGHNAGEQFAIDFPVPFSDDPAWHVSMYNSETQTFSNTYRVHAAGYEALALNVLDFDGIGKINTAFEDSYYSQALAQTLSVLNPDRDLDGIIGQVKELESETIEIPLSFSARGASGAFKRAANAGIFDGKTQTVSLPKAIMIGMAPFFLSDRTLLSDMAEFEAGIGPFVHGVSIDDMRFMAQRIAEGKEFSNEEVSNIRNMMQDTSFFDRAQDNSPNKLTFRQIVDVTLLPKPQRDVFKKLWAGRLSGDKYTYEDVLDVTYHYGGWGKTLERIATSPYGEKLTKAELEDLAQPKNNYLLVNYEALFQSTQTRGIALSYLDNGRHEDLKTITKRIGPMSGAALIFMQADQVDDLHNAKTCAVDVFSFVSERIDSGASIDAERRATNVISTKIVQLMNIGHSYDDASDIVLSIAKQGNVLDDGFEFKLDHELKGRFQFADISGSFVDANQVAADAGSIHEPEQVVRRTAG